MTKPQRIFAGQSVRALRERHGMKQAELARALSISVSYLSQIENDDRPLTAPILATLTRRFGMARDEIGGESSDARAEALMQAASDPIFAEPLDEALASRAVRQLPHLAERFVALHRAYRHAGERLQMLDEALGAGTESAARLPWEEVRDWFHDAGNYIDTLDRAGEDLAASLAGDAPSPGSAALERFAQNALGLMVIEGDGDTLRSRERERLVLDSAQPPETRRFQLAHQIVALALEREIAAVVAGSGLSTQAARELLAVGLANYTAGALLMPYAAFRAAALEERHDIDRLTRRFAVSFEQACHRLSTLQRPDLRGLPFFFCRVDMAGNITKRHSATRLQFARFGGACPLWIVHEAVAIPDRILTQLAEMPDGVRYVSMAKGLVKPSGSFARPPRRYAVALGCEAEHAASFIYADGLDLAARMSATPIGTSCRICPRETCDQRAFPPGDRAIVVDRDRRGVVPYRIA
ncbi:short-chain fatty acyl-CoA regulator family protein [Croceicoccus sp. BE223]|uniref:helix-turn-helix domain-containing protein n=1 Tax=Croceicoccus sp. BE223 TaxID=2817716 RepID=UPI0028594513|nr:short-chain fatty acyl-CoA regulator family protein [Croceicoccus sp. BE223]MDR7102899.1 putative transcriptional regulator/transcriptional regulator with XRE-family HTH domain [Croceicoccus sp. BE223]